MKYEPGASHQVPDLLSRPVAAIGEEASLEADYLKEAYRRDPPWRGVVEYLQEKAVPRRKLPLNEFELKDGGLFHARHLPDKILHRVIPRELGRAALKVAHASVITAQPRVYRTYCKLWDLFYFPNMFQETKEYVKSCSTCQRRHRQAPMAKVPEVSQPFERVFADLLDLHSFNNGNSYILSITDHLTRYLQLKPLPSKGAETVTTAFIQHYVPIFGPPRILQTYTGSEFTDLLFSQVCQLLETKTSFTRAYYPQVNGMVE